MTLYRHNVRDLPAGSFTPSGTNVNTCLVSVQLRGSC